MASQHDIVEPLESFSLPTERLANQTFQAIALNSAVGNLLADGHAQSGLLTIADDRQNHKVAVRVALTCFEGSLELCTVGQTRLTVECVLTALRRTDADDPWHDGR